MDLQKVSWALIDWSLPSNNTRLLWTLSASCAPPNDYGDGVLYGNISRVIGTCTEVNIAGLPSPCRPGDEATYLEPDYTFFGIIVPILICCYTFPYFINRCCLYTGLFPGVRSGPPCPRYGSTQQLVASAGSSGVHVVPVEYMYIVHFSIFNLLHKHKNVIIQMIIYWRLHR
jgi:hypothetical protein